MVEELLDNVATDAVETEVKVEENKEDKAENNECMKYEDTNIDSRIIRAIKEMGYENMTPIQEQAIPALMEGIDVIGQAQTGTGKTAAFGIPMLQKIDEDKRCVQGVILCPTRELAIQAAEELRKYSKYMHGIKMAPIYGGQDIVRQIKALKDGAQIIVGTPGRVMDHMRRHTVKFDQVKMVVLDEADEMLNMGFREDMETILAEIKQEHQTALFSATMPQAILDITDQYQKNPTMVKITKKELTISLIKQIYFVVKNVYKEEVISRLLEIYGFKRSLIFCNTKRMVDELSENLKNRGYQAEGLHGDMTQKQRDFVMNRFKNGNLEILIATDVAARGIDVDDLEAVFNYDIPQDIEYYVHRIGRTGRAGREGMAFTFGYGRDLYKIRDIERICKTKMTEMKVPKADQIMNCKIDKVLKDAAENAQSSDLSSLQETLEEKLTALELDPMEVLTALVKTQVGEKLKDIVVEEPKYFGVGGKHRSENRLGAREGGEGRRRFSGERSDRKSSNEGGYRRDRKSSSEDGFRRDRKSGSEDGYRKDRKNASEDGYRKDRKSDSEEGFKRERKTGSEEGFKRERKTGSEEGFKRDKKSGSDNGFHKERKSSEPRKFDRGHEKSFREKKEKVDVRRDGSKK